MYPLKFRPVFQERIWGGQGLRTVLGKPLPAELAGKPVGESWELADLPAGTVQKDSRGAAPDGSLSSVITNGPWAGKTLQEALAAPETMGHTPLLNGRFPLLIKYLDARENLSLQVHPDAAYCAAHPNCHVKSEAWYIVHAEPGAKLYKGVKPGVTREQFRQVLEGKGDLAPLLNAFAVKAGDCHYLESGTVHALGAGMLVAEVQTPSDTTFRVFDWNRLGPDGKGRTLHVAEAMETIHFGPADAASGGQRSHIAGVFVTVSRLVTCEHFIIERVKMAEGYEQEIPYKEPVVWMVLEGQGILTCRGAGPTAFAKGDTLLLPANMEDAHVKMVTDGAWLEAKVPSSAS